MFKIRYFLSNFVSGIMTGVSVFTVLRRQASQIEILGARTTKYLLSAPETSTVNEYINVMPIEKIPSIVERSLEATLAF